MRPVIALVLLLVQLRPFAGAAACLYEGNAAEPVCGTAEHAPQSTSAAPTTGAPADEPRVSDRDASLEECQLAAFCAVSAPVVLPQLAAFPPSGAVYGGAVATAPALDPGEARAPPHHPPSV